MYAYKWVELKPNDDVNFVRPMSYPGSFWPDTAESATIMAGAVSYLKSLGAIKQFYKLTGNLLECYTIFNTKENAEAWLKDAEQEAKEIIESFRNPENFTNVDGTTEQWNGAITAEEIADKIEKEFELFKENFINELKQQK